MIPPADAPPPLRAAATLYRVFWRWHFYAGLLTVPTLLIITLTGTLYIFRAEIEDLADAHLRFVAPGPARLAPRAQVDLAAAAHPTLTATELTLPADPARATTVRLRDPRTHQFVLIYIDPHRGTLRGSTRPDAPGRIAAFFDLTLTLHRTLLAGTPGRLLVELTVGWTLILLATGLYLWWPRHSPSRGTWWPRLASKPYTLFRDLHNVLGFYLLAPLLLIAATGLFYSPLWGESFHLATRPFFPAPPRVPTPPPPVPTPRLDLDRLAALARTRYPDRTLTIALQPQPDGTLKLDAANDYNRPFGPYRSDELRLAPDTLRTLSHKSLAADPRYWWHGWIYPLHVGSVYGLPTKILYLLACLVLLALPLTGLTMYLLRRPPGRAGLPRRPDLPLPYPLLALIALTALLLPAVGLSMLLILAGELAFARFTAGSPRIRPGVPGPARSGDRRRS